MELNEEQKIALEVIKEWASGKGPPQLSLTGAAGVGKTSLIVEAKKHMTEVHFCAMTGKASLRLSQVANVQATTLHRVLYKRPDQLKNGEIEFKTLSTPSFKYLVIDESSLITPKIYDDLQQWVYFYKIRILFIGDSFQLPPILTEADKKNGDGEFTIFSLITGPELTKIMRSDDGIIKAATIIREEKRIPTEPNDAYSVIEVNDPMEYAINEYLADPIDHMLITWRNSMRMDGNHRIRQKLGHTHYLPDEGEPIIFRRNGQNVLNGEIQLVKRITTGPTIANLRTHNVLLNDGRSIICSTIGKDEQMDGNSPFIKDWKGYLKARRKMKLEDPVPITYGYVATSHTSQGNEFRRATVVLEGSDLSNTHFRAMTKLPSGKQVAFGIRLLYTSLTRAKEKTMLVIGA